MNELQMNGFHGEELEIKGEHYHENVLSQLNYFRHSHKFCDVNLVVEQHDVPAHKSILVACSPYLFDLFTTEEESGLVRGTCKLKDVEFKSFQRLLDYMYTGRMVLPCEEVKGVYLTARKLRMEEVSRTCVAFLANNLTPLNCLGIRSYAQEEEFRNMVDEYIESHFSEVIVSQNFFSLPNLQIEVVCGDEELLDASQVPHLNDLILIWVKDNIISKKIKLERLVEQCNLLYLTKDNTLQDCQEYEDINLKDDELIQDYRKMKRKQNGARNGCDSELKDSNKSSLPFQKFSIISDDTVLEKEFKIIAYSQTADNTYVGISVLNGSLITVSLHCRVAKLSRSNSCSDVTDSPSHSCTDNQFERSRSLTPLSTMSTPRCGFGLRAVNNKLIACGGYDRSECLKSTETFDFDTNTWATLSDMKTIRGRFSAARLGNKVYACGGSNGYKELQSVEVYDIETDTWSFVQSLSKQRSSPGVAVLDNKLFCVGGCLGQDSLATCEVYDPVTNKWSSIASMNTARYQASVRAYQDKLYVMGGTDGWNCLSSVEVYDPLSDKWTEIESLNIGRRGAAVECFQGKLYVIGGNDGTHSLKSTEILDLSDETWKFGPVLTSRRSNAGSAVLGSRLFAVGGFNGKKFLDTMEYLDDSNEWTYYTPTAKRNSFNNGMSSSTDSLDTVNSTSALDDPLH